MTTQIVLQQLLTVNNVWGKKHAVRTTQRLLHGAGLICLFGREITRSGERPHSCGGISLRGYFQRVIKAARREQSVVL